MPPGPKPKPPHLKVIEGNPGKRPIPTNHPKPAPAAPAAPNWNRLLPGPTAAQLRKDAAAEWKRVVPVLNNLGLLSVVDNAVLTDYCICWSRLLECERTLAIEGMVKDTDRGPAKHPLTTVAGQYRTALKTYVGELGLGPSSRGRLAVPGTESDNDVDLFGF
jgi:P27 family predicted phage terminase small subunit